ncbi:hypothetical protein ACKUFS_20880 [Pseudomonas cannabina]|uniref:Uncharacterized protein n=1 Tax=Pseudomonas syringae pv. maculicola str. ES4326 TaxID=629265 RepID=A0A8T8C989_PSEYM|nr:MULTISPECIES: hypothetical protein [Pseudomonas syringae group]KPB72508.1 Uncharacterized protein AC507_2505 [Pseudomonas syringae pv. maculicola]QHE99773.1 hypothetical protein PMA4326_026260 [Pseudomonas syringae pv. maculicola str. ES4326]QQN21808.1 hypothetical protein JGS08_25195 [Pseudomonas cannabina pv. alisalensis]UBY95480.1 hypothetical protein LCG56_15675 [Pseudomonas cannabina pv. alisalensis]
MAALDYLIERGISAKRVGMRVRISPRAKVTEEVSRYVKQNRLRLLAELTADDGVERRCAWIVVVPGHQPFTMIDEPITRDEALADVHGRWPNAELK